MAPCYSKNAILQGTIDSFCLVCDTYLKTEEDYIEHLSKPIHKKNFESTQYVKDFEDDRIRKTKNGYFCELCNELLTIMARVKVHVTETSHTNNRCMMVFERDSNNVIAFGQVVVNERSWSGLNAESCAVCNTEYDDEVMHKNQKQHIINLVQSTPEVDNDKNMYRKIGKIMFQCLTCNMVLGLSDKKSHFDGDDHKKQYQNCLVTNNTNIGEEDSEKNEAEDIKNMKDKSEDVKEQIKDRCEDVKEKIKDRSEDLKETTEKETENIQPKEKNDEIKTVKGKTQNKKHSDEAKQLDKIKLTTKSTHLFSESIIFVKHLSFSYVVINDKFLMSFQSFAFMTVKKRQIECAVCKILTSNFDHFYTDEHSNMVYSVPVVTNVEDEFVREINSGFHCGFCNMVFLYWKHMLKHLNSNGHKNTKRNCARKLEIHFKKL